MTIDSGIAHDGTAVTSNEEMSATCEQLIVYLWLVLIDKRLPLYVCRVYAHDLQTRSLKDIQPQICQSMDSLLGELNTQEDSQAEAVRTISKMNATLNKMSETVHTGLLVSSKKVVYCVRQRIAHTKDTILVP